MGGCGGVSTRLGVRGTFNSDHGSNIVISDKSAADATMRLANDHRVLVEPASGAALAPVYEKHQHEKLENAESVLVIVSGGVGISMELLRHFCQY